VNEKSRKSMNPREEIKLELLESPKRKVYIDGIPYICEGQAFIQHECAGGFEMNEVLFTRGYIQKMPDKLKAYFWDVRNCVINCTLFHQKYGHSRDYRDFVLRRHKALFGGSLIEEFFRNAPFKKQPVGI